MCLTVITRFGTDFVWGFLRQRVQRVDHCSAPCSMSLPAWLYFDYRDVVGAGSWFQRVTCVRVTLCLGVVLCAA